MTHCQHTVLNIEKLYQAAYAAERTTYRDQKYRYDSYGALLTVLSLSQYDSAARAGVDIPFIV